METGWQPNFALAAAHTSAKLAACYQLLIKACLMLMQAPARIQQCECRVQGRLAVEGQAMR